MKIMCDVSLKTIVVSETDNSDKNLYFGFTDLEESRVVFDKLSFGVAIYQGGSFLLQELFPKDGLSYDSTDQTFLASLFLDAIKLGLLYTVKIFATNAGETWEENFDLILPRWPQPFQSWLWNDSNDCWVAPVDYPDDGQNYEWDEIQRLWTVVEPNALVAPAQPEYESPMTP